MPNLSERARLLLALKRLIRTQYTEENEDRFLKYALNDQSDASTCSRSDDSDSNFDSSDSSNSDSDLMKLVIEDPSEELGELMELLYDVNSCRYLEERARMPKSKTLRALIFQFRDPSFRSRARMSKASFLQLLEAIENHAVFQNNSNNKQHPVWIQLLLTLERYGTYGNESHLYKARSIGATRSSMGSIFSYFVTILVEFFGFRLATLLQCEYLLGDSGYTLSSTMITPYNRGMQDIPINEAFNEKFSSARVRIEHVNGILKGRWASLTGLRLKTTTAEDMEYVNQWITACIILHNFLLADEWTESDGWFEEETPSEDDIEEFAENGKN
ncbi:hypothetical protein BCR33DRAFT_792679 [Rhizoclosmatium globosum]|uniref:POU-specific domain-containing protein n=1 Tax=Rhizoclosmatium globosum TaxID=329046 RepID=A0A1Y2B654_9FUNG|nr:hypothetical protein BCR33DRAFT_792679 [Rhizoclosmatium globosum]|eukprot:ORY30322.1 hypothetical protein BCR33DRAFT_792679 [Rhizoclosmatium globosum]